MTTTSDEYREDTRAEDRERDADRARLVKQVKAFGGPAPIVPILMIGIGGYLAWFAVKYWRGEGPAVWPSYPVKSVLQGKGLPPRTAAATASVTLTSWESQAGSSGGGTGGGGYPGAPKGQAQNTAKMLLARYGWGRDQLGPLISLWTRESGWSNSAWNPSGAYGIAQALGHAGPGECATGPRSVGSTTPGVNCAYGSQYGLTPAQAKQANAGNLLQQIRWGLGYIRERYKTPAAAWAHEQAAGWY